MTRIVELSHRIEHGMITYPGLPGPVVSIHISREESAARLGTGVSFLIGRLDMVGNTGTYLDAPYHFHAGAADMADLPAERLVDLPAVVIRAVGRPAVGPELLGDPAGLAGTAVLVHTGWSRHWGSEAYFAGSPFLTAAAARVLVDAGIALLGIDALNVDDTGDLARPVHHTVLGAGIPLLEHLTGLDRLPDRGARLTALPPPVRGMASLPVRAVAVLPTG